MFSFFLLIFHPLFLTFFFPVPFTPLIFSFYNTNLLFKYLALHYLTLSLNYFIINLVAFNLNS